jgi:hypothetical protein
MPGDAPNKQCQLCGRVVASVTRHHLVPKTRLRKHKRRTGETRQTELVDLCRPCHSTIHVHLTEKQLEQDYASLEALRQHPEIARFIKWVRKQSPNKRIIVRKPRDDR